ncbi:MAG: hypothetical protein OXG94_07955 [Bacteroidetes bacterium]|nr:hypothetical protein [Bacteroidota bacterium]
MAKAPAGLIDQIQLIFGDLVDLNRRDLVGTGIAASLVGHDLWITREDSRERLHPADVEHLEEA